MSLTTETTPLLTTPSTTTLSTSSSGTATTSLTTTKATTAAANTAATTTNTTTTTTATEATTAKTTDSKKVKASAPFLHRKIEVKNPLEIDSKILLQNMKTRLEASREKWRKKAKLFRFVNMCATVLIILIQLAQVVVFQLPVIPSTVQKAVATILPALTGSIIALQLKLGWTEKSAKCKKTAQTFSELAHHVVYRLEMLESGGILTDSVSVWNASLQKEGVSPAFIIPY